MFIFVIEKLLNAPYFGKTLTGERFASGHILYQSFTLFQFPNGLHRRVVPKRVRLAYMNIINLFSSELHVRFPT